MFKTSIEGSFLETNPAMATMLGYDSSEDLIHHITNISTQLYVRSELWQAFLDQLETTNIVQAFEVERYCKNGDRIWAETSARAIRDLDAKLIGIESFMVDISRRKQMEMELRQAHGELENRVNQRTKDLEEKTAKLERVNRLFIDRELRMKELKAELNTLKAKPAQEAKRQ